MLNTIVLVGNLGGDPEVFFDSEGRSIASFSLAFSVAKSKTAWIKVICFSRMAEIAEKYLHKGARIAVVGSLDHQKWEAHDGTMRSTFQIIANCIEFIKTDGRGFEGEHAHANEAEAF